METIRAYIDQMFRELPKTKEVIEMKLNILDHMEEKYTELVKEGKNEAEASRMVINEFGDMDEILKELDIDITKNNDDVNYISNETVETYIKWKSTVSIAMGMGVVLCINAVGIASLISSFMHGRVGNIITGVIFFSMIAVAVGIFIYFGMKDEQYEYIEKEPVIDASKVTELKAQFHSFNSKMPVYIIIGVLLCIASIMTYPLIDYMFPEGIANFTFFLIVSIAVFIFIYAGTTEDKYKIFIDPKKTGKQAKKEEKIGIYSGVIMMVATIIFLVIGILFHAWHPGWLVFPVGGVMCGIVSMLVREEQ